MYYPSFEEKTAYLMCSLAGSQHFSNGNKRLSIMMLMTFLILNHARVRSVNLLLIQELVRYVFPLHLWQEVDHVSGAYNHFLYNVAMNVAMIIGNPDVWDTEKFDDFKEKIERLFTLLYKLP